MNNLQSVEEFIDTVHGAQQTRPMFTNREALSNAIGDVITNMVNLRQGVDNSTLMTTALGLLDGSQLGAIGLMVPTYGVRLLGREERNSIIARLSEARENELFRLNGTVTKLLFDNIVIQI